LAQGFGGQPNGAIGAALRSASHDINRVQVKSDLGLSAHRAMFDQEPALVKLLVAIKRADAKWIGFDDYMSGAVGQ
jgi:hypothetical protein